MKIQAHRVNPEKPSVVKVLGTWFAQIQDLDAPDWDDRGYIVRHAMTQPEAFAKVPEILAAFYRRKLGWTEE